MLVIRSAQLSRIGEALAARFDTELISHLCAYTPREAQRLGPDGLTGVVTLAKQRAAQVGFTHRETIRLYLDLMVLLGSGFATDPQYPWAAAALTPGGEPQEQERRADALHARVLQYTQAVLGEQREFLLAALDRVTHTEVEELCRLGTSPDALRWHLRAVFPQKCAYLGEDVVHSVIRRATRTALHHAIATDPGVTVLTILMFLLGHEVDRDPTVPWVEEALRDSRSLEPRQRIETLHAATCTNIRLLVASRRTHHGLG